MEAAMFIGGGLLSAAGQLQQGEAARAAGEYNAEVAEQNAIWAIEKSAADERKFRSTMKRQLGDMRASIGASGVTMDGSAMDVLEDSAAAAEMDAQAIKTMGERQAWGFKAEASLARYQAAAGVMGAGLGAAGTLLGAGAQAYGAMPLKAGG